MSDLADWPFDIPGVEVVDAHRYLTAPEFSERKRAQLFNLCRSYKYQSQGYYVTLLATARGHRVLPTMTTIQDLKSPTSVRFVSEELDQLIQQTLKPLRSREFTLSVYFGHNLAHRYEALCQHLFQLVPAPLLRATFVRPNGKWLLRTTNPIPLEEIPRAHGKFVVEQARAYFAGRRPKVAVPPPVRYDLAILTDPQEQEPPSNVGAIEAFTKAAAAQGVRCELITRNDFGRLLEFDALFIRETTNVNHYTYQFARRAAREGLVVIDDPESILRCCNKVYLAELLTRNAIDVPRTIIVHRHNVDDVGRELGFPCVLKKPDAAFSRGVVKVHDEVELKQTVGEFLKCSDLVIAQEFLKTDFDWRVGVLDGEALFASQYHMARGHWQIIKRDGQGQPQVGVVKTVPVEAAPPSVIDTAVRSAQLIGDGLYGVDLKQTGDRVVVVEINDNPNIDAGNEDSVLKDRLYERLVACFVERLDRKRRVSPARPRGVVKVG